MRNIAAFSLLLLFFYARAYGLEVKTAMVGISPQETKKTFSVGDEVKIQVLLREKLPGTPRNWSPVSDKSKGLEWTTFGDIAVKNKSIREIDDDPTVTKIEMNAILVGAGSLSVKELKLEDASGSYQIISEGSLAATNVSSLLTEEERGKPNWYLGMEEIGGWNWWRLVAAFFVLAALPSAVVWRFLQSRRFLFPAQRLDPKTEALQALKQLERLLKGTGKSDQSKKFSYGLSEALRVYAARRFNVPAQEWTDRELIGAMHSHVSSDLLSKLEKIFHSTTEARYGTRALDAQSAASLLTEAENFVVNTYVEPEKAEKK